MYLPCSYPFPGKINQDIDLSFMYGKLWYIFHVCSILLFKTKQIDKQQNNHKPCHHVTPKELINSYIHIHQESWPPLCYVFWSVLSIYYLTCIFDECLLFTKTYFSLIPLIFPSPVSEFTAIALTVGNSSRLAHSNSQKTIQRDWQWWRQNRCFMLSEPTWGKNRDLVIW